MSTVNIIDTYSPHADVRTALLRGAGLIAGKAHTLSHQRLVSITPKTRFQKWYTLDNEDIVSPLGCVVNKAIESDIDLYTLDSDSLCFYGGFILGDFSSMDLPVIDLSSAHLETALSDFMASAFMAAMHGLAGMAYALMQAVAMLLSLYASKNIEIKSAPVRTGGIVPYVL